MDQMIFDDRLLDAAFKALLDWVRANATDLEKRAFWRAAIRDALRRGADREAVLDWLGIAGERRTGFLETYLAPDPGDAALLFGLNARMPTDLVKQMETALGVKLPNSVTKIH